VVVAFRNKRNRHDQWQRFRAAHADAIAATNLPASLFRTEEVLVSFLTAGACDDPPFSLSSLSESQFRELDRLLDKYFINGWDKLCLTAFIKQQRERSERHA
jgi:hypothetical protein